MLEKFIENLGIFLWGAETVTNEIDSNMAEYMLDTLFGEER